ncbi:MAG: NHL repeat-containing protein [Minwuia sp.]|nr:NHL repeat-containing protein [Minwuia sp.]
MRSIITATALSLTVLLTPVLAQAFEMRFEAASEAVLDNPHDLKLDAGQKYLLVSDVGNNRVAFLDPVSLTVVGGFGADHQSGTHDVDFDADGRLLVADTHNNRVTIYELDGTRGALVGELSERVRGPEGVLAGPDGRIYVAGAWSHNVVVYRDGAVVGELKGLRSPHDLEWAPDGNIWLSDAGNDRMLLLSPDLEILKEWSGPAYTFNGVRYQDVLPDGTVIAADKNSHQVKVISADGELLLTLGTGRPGKGPNQFTTPEGVEVRGDLVWISDSGNDRVVRYRIIRD